MTRHTVRMRRLRPIVKRGAIQAREPLMQRECSKRGLRGIRVWAISDEIPGSAIMGSANIS